MKKNITINLSGRLFNIDEDAYQLLKHYTDTLRRYYGKHEGDTEIADDIETRIAELFEEIMANGNEAITIEHVQGVISRIGELEDLAPEEDTTDEQPADEAGESTGNRFRENIESGARNVMNTLRSGKRFYRDMQNKLVGGVLAGCAQYFGGSPLSWRIGFVLSFLLLHSLAKMFHLDPSGVKMFFLFGYIGLMILAPKAENPEDVLQMKGEDVTPQNIGEEVKKQNARGTGLMGSFLGLVVTVFLGLAAVWLSIQTIVALCFGGIFFTNTVRWFSKWFDFDLSVAGEVLSAVQIPFILSGVSFIVISITLLYCVFHALASHLGRTAAMGFKQRIAWLLIFIVGVVTFVVSCTQFVTVCKDYSRKFYNEWQEKDRQNHMIDGYYFSDEDRDFFNREGWKLVKGDNCEHFTSAGEYWTGDIDVRYLDAFSTDRNIVFQTERSENVEAGTYQLQAVARCSRDAKGVYIYAIVEKDGKEEKYLTKVPGNHNEGRQIYQGETALEEMSPREMDKAIEANDSRGFGWACVRINDIKVTEAATIRYGVTTDEALTGEHCDAEWLSATDFSLIYDLSPTKRGK